MALPPRGDVRRPMHLAVRSMWVFGSVLLLVGLCGIGGSLFSLAGGATVPPHIGLLQLLGATFYWLPGVLFIVFAVYLQRRQFWAVVGGMVVACVELLLLLMGLAVLLVFHFAPHSDLPRAFLIVIGVMAVAAAALAQLVYHLARSFQAIREPPYGKEQHGFEPVMAVRVSGQPAPANLPIEPGVIAANTDATSPPR